MGHFFYTPVHQTEVEVLLQDSGRLQCKSALLTRAGEDLGVRKENQDSALALREYRTGDEALFGVFDGHGPNGETVVTSLYPHSVNILCVLSTYGGNPMQAWCRFLCVIVRSERRLFP